MTPTDTPDPISHPEPARSLVSHPASWRGVQPPEVAVLEQMARDVVRHGGAGAMLLVQDPDLLIRLCVEWRWYRAVGRAFVHAVGPDAAAHPSALFGVDGIPRIQLVTPEQESAGAVTPADHAAPGGVTEVGTV